MKSKSNAKPIVVTIVSLIIITLATIAIVWLAQNWNKLEQGMDGSNLYTYEDLQSSYEDGYNTAIKNEESYLQQIQELKNSLDLEKNQNNALVEYYEKLLTGTESNQIAIATFTIGSDVFRIIRQEKDTTLVPPTPESTDYTRFTYWELNGKQVDFNNYTLTESVTFNANLTYFYDVKFADANNLVFESQIVEENTYATLPTNAPIKDNYYLKGYSLTQNGDLVNLNELKITKNTTLYAIYGIQLSGTYRFTDLIDTSEQDTVFIIDFTLDKGNLTNVTSQNGSGMAQISKYDFIQVDDTTFKYDCYTYSTAKKNFTLFISITIMFDNDKWIFDYKDFAGNVKENQANGVYSSIIKL